MAGASRITGAYVRLAETQHGVVALEQLVGLGPSEAAVLKRTHAGHLHRVHVGVYAIVPPSMLSL
jgi:predicted transcriptional regulator of viral defense system